MKCLAKDYVMWSIAMGTKLKSVPRTVRQMYIAMPTMCSCACIFESSYQ